MRRGFFRRVALSVALIGAGMALSAQTTPQIPPQRPPTFRTGIDLSRVSVRVLDQQRKPVRGLTDKDFTVIINGVSQPIVTVIAEDESGPVTPSAPWMRDIGPDVATNTLENPRLIVIVLDDIAANSMDPFRFYHAKLIGKAIIEQLGSHDLASVVFTADNRAPQDFTTDHARLMKALDRFHPTSVPGQIADAYRIDTIRSAVAFLRERPDVRSAIMWVGAMYPKADEYMLPLAVKVQPGAGIPDSNSPPLPSNLPAVYSISTTPVNLASKVTTPENSLSGATGGRWVGGTNTPEKQIPEIFAELSVRYTIGFQETEPNPDGRFRRIEVRVNRPDVIILPQHPSYFAPKAKDIARVAAAEAAASETTLALSGMIPLADEPLRLAVAAFAPIETFGKGDFIAEVTVALGVDIPFEFGRAGDTIELETRVFDGEGRKQIEERHQSQTLRPRSGQDRGQFDLLSTLSLKPGRYNLRLSMHSTARDRSGSVYTDFVVPDFGKAPLSLSGAVVSLTPGPAAVPAGVFLHLLPADPTTTREFASNDLVRVFLRAYSGSKQADAVTLHAEIRNTQDAMVFSEARALTWAGGTPRSADYRLQLPLAQLAPDDYLLSIRGKGKSGPEVRRDVRFTVR